MTDPAAKRSGSPASGMLIIWTDVDPSREAEFNRWYDREHVAERVGLPGFTAGRRFLAVDAERKYLALYPTESLAALDSPAYRDALAHQTAWSQAMLSGMRGMFRLVGTVSRRAGRGSGGALALLRLQPAAAAAEALRERLANEIFTRLCALDGIVAVQLVEADPTLSVPLVGPKLDHPVADWMVLVEGTSLEALQAARPDLARQLEQPAASVGLFRLMWQLARGDLA